MMVSQHLWSRNIDSSKQDPQGTEGMMVTNQSCEREAKECFLIRENIKGQWDILTVFYVT